MDAEFVVLIPIKENSDRAKMKAEYDLRERLKIKRSWKIYAKKSDSQEK